MTLFCQRQHKKTQTALTGPSPILSYCLLDIVIPCSQEVPRSNALYTLYLARFTPAQCTTYHQHLHGSHALVIAPCFLIMYHHHLHAERLSLHQAGAIAAHMLRPHDGLLNGCLPSRVASIREVCLASALATAKGSCVISPLRRSISSWLRHHMLVQLRKTINQYCNKCACRG